MTTPPIIDAKLPLTWLISSAAIIVMSLAGFALNSNSNTDKTQAKLDSLRADQAILIINIAKLEKRVDDRDSRTDAIKEAQYSILRTVDGLNMRVETLERVTRK